jgi:hypothetical protein
MDGGTNRERALEIATAHAIERLSKLDLEDRCERLGIDIRKIENELAFASLGREVAIDPVSFGIRETSSGAPVSGVERLLILHYLQWEGDATPAGEIISFRDFPGGAFYYNPFRGRTVAPLVRAIGTDLNLLRERLDRLKWDKGEWGDTSAVIRVFGRVSVILVYHKGDDEFPPDAEMLFDAALRRIFSADDISALAALVCARLIRNQ